MISPQILFWLLLLTIVYIYLGYPLLILLLSRLRPKHVRTAPCALTVSILIAAHNEAQHIARTIENKLASDYPRDRLQIIVVSDASTDGTDAIVARYAQSPVTLLRQEPRGGKTAALNMAVAAAATGEILVFSDANSIYAPHTLRNLVQNFSDPEIGYVTGHMIYTNPSGTLVGDGCSAYMKYENFLREHETRVGSVIGVDGGIDAIRRVLYHPMRPDQLPDFVLPLMVVERGYRVVYDSRAILWEEVQSRHTDEYRMRVRVALRSLCALRDMKHLLNIFRHGLFSVQLFSHKVLRYFAFLILGALYITNILLWGAGSLYRSALLLQTLVYACSLGGYLAQRGGRPGKPLHLPYYFVLLNVAAAHAFFRFLKGTKQVIWEPRAG